MLEGKKTFIGLAVIALAEAARWAGVEIGDPEGVVNAVLLLAGVAIAVYGRIVAKVRFDQSRM